MKNSTVLPPSVDLIEGVVDRLLATSTDYSENLVVFPGKRPAHFLRRTIAERIGTSYVPPTVLSMEEFIDRVYETLTRTAPKRIETIDAVAFLFEIHRGMDRPLGGSQFLSLETFFRLGVRIYRDLEELLIEHVDPQQLRTVEPLMEAPLPPQADAGLQSLSYFYDRFYQAIDQAGLSTRSGRYRLVSSGISTTVVPWRRIILAGFYALTESEKRLFNALLAWEHVFPLFQEGPGLGERLVSLGIEHATKPESGSPPPAGPEIVFHKSPDSHGQVFDLGGELKKQIDEEWRLRGVPPTVGPRNDDAGKTAATVIVLPTPETLFPVLYHALPVIPGGEYNISLGYPLERTPTWGFLSGLMQLVASMDGDRLYIPSYLELVLHPYTKNIYLEGRTEITRILFHTLEELLLEDRTKSFIGLDEIEAGTDLFRLVEKRTSQTEQAVSELQVREHLRTIHSELIRKACVFRDIRDFSTKMMEIIAFVYNHSSARLHPFFHPFAESFMNELDGLRRSRVKDLAFSERNSYFHFLKGYIPHCFTPFDGTPLRGVQVLGFLETRNLRFERAYVLDANEDVIPDTKKEDTLLPFKVRQILRLPTYLDRDMLSAYYFETLIRGSRRVDIFYAENGRKEKSRFVEKLLWERQKRDRADGTAAYVRSVGYRLSLEGTPPQSIPKLPSMIAFLRDRSYDATSLDVYLNCPLQFYYKYVLNLVRKEEAGADVERLDIGRLVHVILLRYFEKRKGIPLTEEEMDVPEMRRTVDVCFAETYGPEPIGQVYLLKRQVERQMEAFLRHYQVPLAGQAAITILGLEQRLETAANGFRFKGIIDRIEARSGRTHILDYKTGATAARLAVDFKFLEPNERTTWNQAIGSVQLPLYLLLYERYRGKVGTEPANAMFLLLGKSHLDRNIEVPLFREEDDAPAKRERVNEVIFRLVGEIVDPDVPFDPVLRKKGACTFCDYQYLCGTQMEGK